YTKEQLLGVSPATTKNLARGMTVAELCEAAVIYSDNCAANLLLAAAGGPGAVTAFWRRLGDTVTRLDKIEMALNLPDGEKDTTTPAAMMGNLQAMLLGDALSFASRDRLLGWMHANTTGAAMLTPPGRAPILIACYTQGGPPDDTARSAVLAQVGRIIAARFA